jgi:peptidyl-tRNA hydrolase
MMKMIIITRRDLSPGQQTVQSCHAVAEICLRHGNDPVIAEWGKDHKTMVILGVDNKDEIERWESKLEALDVPCEMFREPDIGNEPTAIAIHPSCDRKLVKNLPLL